MINNKFIVSKNILKKSLVEEEELEKTLSRFIDNSIKAKTNLSDKISTCEVNIMIYEDLISIRDNSGGLDPKIRDEEIFKIGNDNTNVVEGVGIKKSFFILGTKMDIVSNNKIKPRKFTLDINLDDDELVYQVEESEYNDNQEEGTIIFISSLEDRIRRKISQSWCISSVVTGLGRIYSKFIGKGQLKLDVNGYKVDAIDIEYKKINSCTLSGAYQVDLYKGDKGCKAGVDLYINGYMFYNREKSKRVKWNLLNQVKHRYSSCIIEINYNGDKLNFLESQDVLFEQVMDFVKENEQYFRSKTVIIQFEADIGQVDELKEYYDEDTAKAIGIKAFENLYQNYIKNK